MLTDVPSADAKKRMYRVDVCELWDGNGRFPNATRQVQRDIRVLRQELRVQPSEIRIKTSNSQQPQLSICNVLIMSRPPLIIRPFGLATPCRKLPSIVSIMQLLADT